MLGQANGMLVRPATGTSTAKVIHVKLSPEMLKSLQGSSGTDVSIDFDGETKGIRIGDKIHSFSLLAEQTAIEIYSHKRGSECLDLEGRVTHKMSMRRELGESVSERLKLRQAQEIAAKQDRSVQTVDARMTRKGASASAAVQTKQMSSTNSSRNGSPARKSQFLQARKSPLLLASIPKSQPIPIKTRLIQTLAISSTSVSDLATRLRSSNESLLPILEAVARKTGEDWALADASYCDVKVWDWKHYTSAERSAVISRVGEALDRLALPTTHPARIRLIHPEKRSAGERADTSPLSLNPPITVDDDDKSSGIDRPSTQASSVAPSLTPVSSSQHEPGAPKRNGLLSAGKTKAVKKIKIVNSKEVQHAEGTSSARQTPKSSPKTAISTPEEVSRHIASAKIAAKARSDRTASLTSVSSNNSSRSQVSTAPSSVADEVIKPLAIVQTPKRSEDKGASNRPETRETPTLSAGQSESSVATSPKKRKAEGELNPETNRQFTAVDKAALGREYKRLYPEYKALMTEVSLQVEDDLFSRFMMMHNQMSKWKSMLSDGV